MIRAGTRWISFGIAALAIGVAAKSVWSHAGRSADAGSGADRAGISVFAERYGPVDTSPNSRVAGGFSMPSMPVRVASLDPEAGLDVATTGSAGPSSMRADRFQDRFTAAFTVDDSVVFAPPVRTTPLRLAMADAGVSAVPMPRPANRPMGDATPLPRPPFAAVAAPEKRIRTASLGPDAIPPAPDTDSHTAIYDITARKVYMPNGDQLEAHSGLGEHMDDPHSVTLRGKGVTPPNVYDLSLRKQIFHGVRAIRLTPVAGSKMYGRDGMLAHSYMLGPNGQSNGCVSFNDYSAFLHAFDRGEVTRLIVVEHLDNPPGGKSGGGWLAQAVKDLFKPSEEAALFSHGQAEQSGAAVVRQ